VGALPELPELPELPDDELPEEPVPDVAVVPVLFVELEVAADATMPMPKLRPRAPATTPAATIGRVSFMVRPSLCAVFSHRCAGVAPGR
jgi:hypothetical protein